MYECCIVGSRIVGSCIVNYHIPLDTLSDWKKFAIFCRRVANLTDPLMCRCYISGEDSI